MEKRLEELFNNSSLTVEELRNVFIKDLVPLVHGENLVGLDRGDVEHLMDGNNKFRLKIGTGVGESRAIDAIGDVLTKLGSVIEEADHARYLMYIEYGAEDLMMDELVRVMNYFEEKVGDEVEMVWGAGRNDELGNQLEILLLAGWK